MVGSHTDMESRNQDVDIEGLIEGLNGIGFRNIITTEDLRGRSSEEINDICLQKAWDYYENKIEPVKDKIRNVEKEVSLRTFDRAWSNHIDMMSKLRDGIGLRSYAQNNPLQAYVTEGYMMFEDMMHTIAQEIVSFCMNIKVVSAQEKKEA